MKKNHFLAILILIIFCGCASKFSNEEACKKVKEIIMGTWELTTDENFVMEIGEDSITYYYKDSLSNKNPYIFCCENSIIKYRVEDNVYNFMKGIGNQNSGVILKEIEYLKDTAINKMIYIDTSSMDLYARNRSVSFGSDLFCVVFTNTIYNPF